MIEPYEGAGKIASVKGMGSDKVRISYRDGSWQEVTVENIKETPHVTLDTYFNNQIKHENS